MGSLRSWLGSGARGLALVWLVLQAVGCATSSPQSTLQDARRAYLDGRKSDAELIWLQSLAEAEAVGEDDPRLTQSLRMLSNLQIQQQRYDEAKPLLERWMDIKERRGENADPEFADGVDALAGIHMVQGRYQQAAALYQ